jgi:2-oxoglutarate ferredoxin oxidoreductase subunit beta
MPYGNYEAPFDPVDLARSAGATFVARGTVYSILQTTNYIKKAFDHKGFSMVEIISQCPTQYGRLNRIGDPKKMLLWQKENSIPVSSSKNMSAQELEGKIITGIFQEEQRREYAATYHEYVKSIQPGTEA